MFVFDIFITCTKDLLNTLTSSYTVVSLQLLHLSFTSSCKMWWLSTRQDETLCTPLLLFLYISTMHTPWELNKWPPFWLLLLHHSIHISNTLTCLYTLAKVSNIHSQGSCKELSSAFSTSLHLIVHHFL